MSLFSGIGAFEEALKKIGIDFDLVNYTENGVSLISVNTPKGNMIFDEVKTQMMIKEVNYDLACSFNHYRNVKEHKNREKFFKGISNEKINSENIIKYMNKYTKKSVYKKIAGKIKVIIKKAIK